MIIIFIIISFFFNSIIINKQLFISIIFIFSCIGIVLSNNFITLYFCFIIQTFSIILYLITQNSNYITKEASIKYFILSSVVGSIFLIGISSSLYLNYNLYFINLSPNINYLLLTLIIFKSGLFPFHFWVSDIYQVCDIKLLYFISILSKIVIIPILYICSNINQLFIIGLFSILVGSISILNQTNIKRIIGYSSIYNIGIVIFISSYNYNISLIYLLIYCIILTFFLLLITTENNIIEIIHIHLFDKYKAFTWLIIILSFAGFPPFIGFLAKSLILNILIIYNSMSILLLLIITSIMLYYLYFKLLTLIFYYTENIFYKIYNNLEILNINKIYLINIFTYSSYFWFFLV
uniref:NADH dehydrogenase subunit 2 n=1 Tax=Gymnopraia lapislazula TaxID=316224 RepID=UPI0026E413F7|nr:NADH dehydrogenase subunit 2 [Gymnopraia lapislazula]WJJ70118.1 NADH dehydrogenase subunit 2 [Gymnopraia lapislazula]